MYCKTCGEFVPKNRDKCPLCGSKEFYSEDEKKSKKKAKKSKVINVPVEINETIIEEIDDFHKGTSQVYQENAKRDYTSFSIALVCFLVPFASLILYMVWKDEYPLKASSASKGGIISVIVGIIMTLVLFYEISGIIASYYATTAMLML